MGFKNQKRGKRIRIKKRGKEMKDIRERKNIKSIMERLKNMINILEIEVRARRI